MLNQRIQIDDCQCKVTCLDAEKIFKCQVDNNIDSPLLFNNLFYLHSNVKQTDVVITMKSNHKMKMTVFL